MHIRNIENGLALAGALLVLVGVTFAAGAAFADETVAGRIPAAATDAAVERAQSSAETANREAADEAVDGIAADNETDLEFRLLDRKLSVVARRT